MLVIPTPEEAAAAEAADAAAAAEAEAGTEVGSEEVAEAEAAAAVDDTQAQLTVEREQRIRLEERLAASQAAPPEAAPAPPVVLTRAQLRAAVDAGTIDEDGMEQVWADQNRAQTRREIGEDQDRRDAERTSSNFIESETAQYLSGRPDIRTQGSSDWTKLKTEYDYLIRTGSKDSKETELNAMRAAFGPAERIAEHTSTLRQTTGETSTSSSGSGGGDKSSDILMKVPKSIRAHYRQMVDDGLKTLDEVKRELPYMRQQ